MRKTVSSIENQTFKNFEVWIVDGMSSAETQTYLAQLKAPFYAISENDSGIYEAMNKGVAMSHGKWLYFIGAGDVFESPTVLEEIFNNKIEPEIQVLLGNIAYDSEVPIKPIFSSNWSFLLWFKNTVHHQSVFYKREIFNRKAFDPTLKVLGDYELNLSLFISSTRAKKIPLLIANCELNGLSKRYNYQLYKEEYQLKIKHAHFFFRPFFFGISILKFWIRKLTSIF